MFNRRPRGLLCWVMAFFTASYQHLLWTSTHQGLKAPSVCCGFPYHISSITPFSNSNWNCNFNSVLTELYNSSTPTQSPTRSLEWRDWSSSSGNNCHAVHRSLSSGALVYECTMGIFFTSSHFISQFPPTRFPLITAIRMCHLLPIHHSEWHFWPGRRSKYHTEDLQEAMNDREKWRKRVRDISVLAARHDDDDDNFVKIKSTFQKEDVK